MALRSLSPVEIENLASRKGASRNAVENFLGSVDVNPDPSSAFENLRADAASYKWKQPTIKAIAEGITLASRSV